MLEEIQKELDSKNWVKVIELAKEKMINEAETIYGIKRGLINIVECHFHNNEETTTTTTILQSMDVSFVFHSINIMEVF